MREALVRAFDGEGERERHLVMALAFAAMDLPLTVVVWLLGATPVQLLTLNGVVGLGVLCLSVERLKNPVTLAYAIAGVPVLACVLSSHYAGSHGELFLTLIMGAAGLTPFHAKVSTVVATWVAATLGWAATLLPRGADGAWAVFLYSWCFAILATFLFVKARRMRWLQDEARSQALAAQVASRAKSQFLAAMGHELRTPLNGVIGMTDVALSGPLTVEQRDSLQTIRGSADWLLATVTSVLEFARSEGAGIAITRGKWQPREVLEELAVLLAPAAHQKALELVVDVEPEVPQVVWGDVFRVRQVLNTLLGNAIKFTDAGFVSLEVRYTSGALSFLVRDTGIGIGEADQVRIFEAFTRIDGSLNRRGTGLGLSLAKELASKMAGSISLTSRVGEGSAFCFVVPSAAAESTARRPPALEGERCAVLSAFPFAQATLERVLAAEGATITDSAQASLVVLDVPVREPHPWLAALRPLTARTVALVAEGEHLRAELKRHSLAGVIPKVRLRTMVEALVGARSRPTPVPAPPEPPAPLFQLPAPSRPVASPVPVPVPLCRALMAEDNPVNAKVLVRLLERLGVQCEVVPDGVEAVQRASEQAFEVIFMDLNMPRMDGLEATRQLRARGLTLPIIAVTARVSSEDEQECMKAGMTAYLTKPVSLKRLEELVFQTLPRLRFAQG